jgi:hypothetical protein
MRSTVFRVLAATGLVVGVGACNSDDVEPPSADALAEQLIDTETYDGDWTVNVPDDAPEDAVNGVVTDEMNDLLPRMEFCDAASAESRAAADDVQWSAFRQIDLTVDDPIAPPDDRTGHIVFVQEFLTSGEPDEIETTFGLLREGMEACLGELPADEEGPGLAEEMALPAVGDDRYGVLYTLAETGGWAEWRLHSAIVRDGPVLLSLMIADIRADAEPYYTLDEVGQMVETAVDLL